MQVHITQLYNMIGTATLAQRGVADIAKRLGYREIPINWFAYKGEETHEEIKYRIQGSIAPIKADDIVIMQYPSFISLNYDGILAQTVKAIPGTKLIIFVEDVQYLLFQSQDFILEWEVLIFNRADELILPSKKLHEFLIAHGLRKDLHVIYQTIWEMPNEPLYTKHELRRNILFTGNYDKFHFLADYHGKTKIQLFSYDQPTRVDDPSFEWRGGFKYNDLMRELSNGGFGLVWSDPQYFKDYYCMNQPHKLGSNLSSGIPVIVRKGSCHEEFIRNHQIGLVVDSLEEADEFVQLISDEEYTKLYQNVAKIQKLLVNGYYTTRTLNDAVIQVVEN